MPILTSDLRIRLSTKTGSVGNSQAQASGALSLGGYLSTTDAPVANNALFPLMTGPDNAGGTLNQYLCLFAVNLHASLVWRGPKLWLTDPAGGALLAVGVDPTAASILAKTSAQAVSAASITSAPPGVTFTAPTTFAAGLALGDIPAGYCRAFWVRRSANNSAGVTAEIPTIRVDGATLG